jgi:hypothetical protein
MPKAKHTTYLGHRCSVLDKNNVLAVLESNPVGYVFVNGYLVSGLRSFCPGAITKPPALVGLFSRRKP